MTSGEQPKPKAVPSDPESGATFADTKKLSALTNSTLARLAQSHSIWPMTFGLACCAIEMMTAASSRYDMDRFGAIFRATPRQSDLMIVSGTVTFKMAPRLKRLYEQMPEPKWVISMGSCANCGGPYWQNGYHVVKGVDTLVPVDVYVLGCPPRPESLLDGLLVLWERIRRGVPHGAQPDVVGESRGITPLNWRHDTINPVTPIKVPTSRPVRQTPKPGDADERFTSWGADAQSAGEAIRRVFGETSARYVSQPLDSYLEVPSTRMYEIIAFLRNDPAMNFNVLANLSGVHLTHPDGGNAGFNVVYHLESWPEKRRLVLKVPLMPESPRVPSITSLYPAANWNERELYDMFGIAVPGHPEWHEADPDRMRILCAHGWQGFPLRKDYTWAEAFDGVKLRRAQADPRAGVWVNAGRGHEEKERVMQEEAKPKPKPKVAAPVVPHPPPPQVAEAAETKAAPLPALAHVAEPPAPLPAVPMPIAGAPHIAEKEHVVSAQIMTLKSPSGDTTIMVERERGKAIHATVIDEKPNEDATKAAKEAKAEETARKGRASRRASKRASPEKPTDSSAEKKGKHDEQAER